MQADLTLPGADAGSKGTGAASSFLLVHRIPVAVMEAGWRPFSQDAVEAKKKAVGTLQGIAGVGVGRALDKFKTLGVPVAVLLLAFTVAQSTRNYRFIHEIAEQFRISVSM